MQVIEVNRDEFRELVYTANFILNQINADVEKLYKTNTDYVLASPEKDHNEVVALGEKVDKVKQDIQFKKEMLCRMINVPVDSIRVMWDAIRFNIRAAGNLLTETYNVEARYIESMLKTSFPGSRVSGMPESVISQVDMLFLDAAKMMKFETGAYMSLTKH